MTSALTVAVLCEGSTDFPVLKAVAEAALAPTELTFRLVQPDFDALRQKVAGTPGPGWQGVRRYLGLPALRVAAEVNDIVVVQVDADVRHLDEVAKVLGEPNEDDEELDPFCRHVKSWMRGGVPEAVVITLPREATEAWLLAVHTNGKNLESIASPVQRLVSAGLVAEDETATPLKLQTTYERLAPPLQALVKDTKKLGRALPELARFVGKLKQRATAVGKARKSA